MRAEALPAKMSAVLCQRLRKVSPVVSTGLVDFGVFAGQRVSNSCRLMDTTLLNVDHVRAVD